MGSSGSKAAASDQSAAASASSSKTRKSRVGWAFQSSCLGAPSGSCCDGRQDQYEQHTEEGTDEAEMESDELKIDSDRKVKNDISCISSNAEVDGSNSSRSSSTPNCFLSRFSFTPGNINFRLSRATSLGSSRAYSDEPELQPRSGYGSGNFIDRIEAQQGGDLLPQTQTSCQDSTINYQLNWDNLQDNQTVSSLYSSSTRTGVEGNLHSPRVLNELENIGTRQSGAQEPVERNVRFSRTLSVGRLRDRVLRRSSLTDLTFCPLQQEREVRDGNQSGGRYLFDSDNRIPTSEGNAGTFPATSGYPPSSMSSTLFDIQDHEVETSQSRDARYHDLLEHRSNFLERRRRIRSQVRALQRLGSRFENLSGHARSCILFGQNRTGHCTCRVSNRDASSNEDTNARASISRIVMLAEALFEVLDEIHQQSVVLSSRPLSSLRSIPAPQEVVESLPVKSYTKSQKHYNEEVAQCYICLVEYDEGDSVRVLPCHHEFHRTCIDKWLKEVHRVCPLCRGDICKSYFLLKEN
ncbi:uncharacterized protein LOC123224184 isoform X2 [Mangifera indica]|uniref:uncharacterized protein LOC123224184 isoform X2 n=1 Tax=Mangifera indica TaxID=29780 RepID=UPI001CFBD57E|nr:uncharacterized protein LOC123224184 isoform X2 [Mangifera indica]